MLAAVKLYDLGRVSSGRAAEFAGTARVEFLLSLGRYRVFPLDAELDELEQRRCGAEHRRGSIAGDVDLGL